MIGCVGALILLFAGLLWAWIMFDVMDYMNDIWLSYSNSLSIDFPFKSIVDLGIAAFPLFVFIMAFVVAYLYLQKRRRRNESQ